MSIPPEVIYGVAILAVLFAVLVLVHMRGEPCDKCGSKFVMKYQHMVESGRSSKKTETTHRCLACGHTHKVIV